MNPKRQKIYNELESKIGRTPLVELPLNLPNGNRIFAKEEYRNPTQSHYDRVYVYLLKELEKEGKIIPGQTPLIETTSGNAGASFAWLCKELGYDATVILPEGLPKARVEDIKKYGAHLMFTPEQNYVGGAAKELGRIFKIENKERKKQGLPKYIGPNHSQDFRTANSLEGIASESLDQLEGNIDFFIPGIGNGASVLGPGQYFKKHSPETQIIAWEPLASGKAFEMRNPGEYERLFGIPMGQLKHTMYGTGVPDVSFPFIDQAVKGNGVPPIVDKVTLVGDDTTEDQLREKIDPSNTIDYVSMTDNPGNMKKVQQILNVRGFPNMENASKKLANIDYQMGRSTAGSVAVALDLINREGLKFKRAFPFVEADKLKDKNFLVIAYDPLWKYANGD